MFSSYRAVLITLISMAVFMGACALPTTYTPSPTSPGTDESIPYTAAAETIEAQLTEIAIANTTGIVPAQQTQASSPTPLPAQSEATATFPSTSTPLPTNTPFPSDTPLPSDTPKPSPTSKPTNTLAASAPTKQVIDPKANLGEPDWQDTFDNAINWPIYNDEHVQMRITQDNQLEMTSLVAEPWESWMLTWPVLTDFYLEVVASPGECAGLDRYGLLARATADAKNGYLYGVTCDGRYSFRIWNGVTFTMIVPWTPSASINTGEDVTNVLGLMAEGNTFSLYMNGELLTTVQDDTFSQGLIGLYIGGLVTDNFTVWFDEVSYWELPSAGE